MDRLLIRPFYESNSNPREKLLWIEKPEANLDRIITSFDGTIILNGHTNNDIKKNTYKHQAILIFINTSNNKLETVSSKVILHKCSDHDASHIVANTPSYQFPPHFEGGKVLKNFKMDKLMSDFKLISFWIYSLQFWQNKWPTQHIKQINNTWLRQTCTG